MSKTLQSSRVRWVLKDHYIASYCIHRLNAPRSEIAIASSPFHLCQTHPHHATSPVLPLPHQGQTICPRSFAIHHLTHCAHSPIPGFSEGKEAKENPRTAPLGSPANKNYLTAPSPSCFAGTSIFLLLDTRRRSWIRKLVIWDVMGS